MARWFDRRFLTPRRFARPRWEREVLKTAKSFHFESGGRRLAAWRWGTEGPTALLVHGWEGRGTQLGAFVAPLLAAGYQVVAYDGPGHGDSEGKLSSMPEKINALHDLQTKIGPVHALVAHSAGAACGAYALSKGFQAERFVAVSPPTDLQQFAHGIGQALGLTRNVLDRMQARIEKRFNIRWEQYRAIEIAPKMTTPLLVVHDWDDHEVPWSGGAAIVKAWPNAELQTTHGLGHRRILRHPQVVESVVAFVVGE